MLLKKSNYGEAKICTCLFKQSVIKYFVATLITLATLITIIELTIISLKTEKHLELIEEEEPNLANKSSLASFSIENDEGNVNIKKPNNNRYLSHIIFDSVKKGCNSVYTAVLIISSHASFVNRRNKIRKIWGKSSYWNTKKKYLIVFVVGRTIESDDTIKVIEEAKIWNDILFIDLFEEIPTLTKKVIIGLKWTNHNVKYEFVFKGHDDIYLNINNLLMFVKKINIENAYFGRKIENTDVKKEGLYKIDKKGHQNDYYDSYCSGVGYILSRSSIEKMDPLFDLNFKYHFDDVFIGEIAIKAGIVPRHAEGFYMNNTSCSYFKDIIVSHPISDFKCNIFLLKSFLQDTVNLTSQIHNFTSTNTSSTI